MKAFVSYARKDEQQVTLLQRDLEELCAAPPWIDRVLAGGQPWWDEILQQIRAADVFVLAASRTSLASPACLSELRYALDVRRHLLPVMVADVELATAPDAIRQTHVIDYRHRSADAAIQLARAIMRFPAVAPLPDELPIPPPMPQSYAQPYRRQLAEKSLDLTQQAQLFAALKIHAQVEDDREEALELIRLLRERQDVTMAVGREIDEFLGTAAPVMSAPPTDTQEAPRVTITSAPDAPPSERGREAAPEPVRDKPLKLPVDELTELLTPFAAVDLYVTPEIPEKAASNARKALTVPGKEPIVALVNLAWFSAGENALVVTDRALHHRKLAIEAHITFDDLAGAEIKLDGTKALIGSDHELSLGGTAAPLPKVESMLKALARACRAAARRPPPSRS